MITYLDAGVDMTKAHNTLNKLKPAIEQTFSNSVLTPLGGFAALYDLKNIIRDYHEPILVQSVDGVGTKTELARLMNHYQHLGSDLVSATTNDILVYGAKPLTLLDYIAMDRLNPEAIELIIQTLSTTCQDLGIALVGGETAEMPGIYHNQTCDLVGMITGVVEKSRLILGNTISPGDLVFAFASSGLHTNGYSLARHVLFRTGDWTVNSPIDNTNKTLGELLIAPHLNYLKPVLCLQDHGLSIKGMAHITGGGVLDNIPRILPEHCAIELYKINCPQLPIFSFLKALNAIDELELYRTFNMGIGYVLIASEATFLQAKKLLAAHYPDYPVYLIGQVIPGHRQVHLCA